MQLKTSERILVNLNHPNIAAIHGIKEADGTRALVLELVEGPTLADRDVALKVLPEAFTSDPDRLARFEREATGMSASGPRHAESDTEALTAVTGLRMMRPMRDVAPRCWRRSTALGP